MTTADNADSSRFVSVKLLLSILIAIVFAATGLILGDTRANVSDAKMEIKQIQLLKLDKDQYYRDMTDIKEILQKMNDKLDKLSTWRR